MKLAKKIISYATIVATAITGLTLIMLLFDTKLFGDLNLKMLLTLVTVGVGGFFAINSMNMISKNKVIGWVSLGLIFSSVLLIVLAVWINFNSEIYGKLTFTLGLVSILFNVIVSSGLALGRSKMIWQVLVYIVVFVSVLIAVLAIFGVVNLIEMLPFFLMMVILSVIGVIILKVLSKKVVQDLVEENKDMVKISKTEYAMLVDKAKKYDELMSKSQNNDN
jgi:hypothetical protein